MSKPTTPELAQLQLGAEPTCTKDPTMIAAGTDLDGQHFEFCCCEFCTEAKEIEARLKREPFVTAAERLPWFNAHLKEQTTDRESAVA